MESNAVRCQNCGKLRKDIYEDKIKCYTFCMIGGFAIGVSLAMESGSSMKTPLLVAGIIIGIVGLYFYNKVSQKLKTYWWA